MERKGVNKKGTEYLKENEEGFEGYSSGFQLVMSRSCMNQICISLCVETSRYIPLDTIKIIEKYIDSGETLGRLLYSEFSSFISPLEPVERDKCGTNLEYLLEYVSGGDMNFKADVKKIVIKLYDHFYLISNQIDNSKNLFLNDLEDTRASLEVKIQGLQKEYITILGIFASIILTFVSGITFSNSVLSNINQVDEYKLFLTIDALALILINLVYLLLKFILHINDKQNKSFLPIKAINIILGIVGVLIILAWFLEPLIVEKLAQVQAMI